MEETNEKIHPSLPPNYVSLADLQQRWMKQKQQQENKREKAKKCEPQQQQIGVKKQQEKRREKEKCETQKPQQQQIGVKKPQEKRREKEKRETQKPNQGKIGVGVKQQQEKRREKEQCEPQNPNLPPRDQIGGKDVKPSVTNSNPNLPNRKPFGRNYGDRKGRMEYRLVKSNLQPKPLMTEAPQIDGGDQVHNNQVDGVEKGKVELKIKKNKNKNKKKKQNLVSEERNPARNGECGGEERENEAKGGGEATLKPAMGDRTVEIEEKFKKISVDGMGWRSNNGRSTAAIEGSRWSVEYRGMGKASRENGMKWVKKGEVPEHNEMK